MTYSGLPRFVLLSLPLIDVLTEVGLASAFPQLQATYGSTLRASLVVAASPMFAVLTGWLWGAAARRGPIKPLVLVGMTGWSVVTFLLGFSIGSFAHALLLRALQGSLSAGFAALPFILITRGASDDRERSRGFGALETSVSVGAIAGPVTVGALLAESPTAVLSTFGSIMGILALVWHRTARELLPAAAPGPGIRPNRMEFPVARKVLRPIVFASGVALLLSAFETLIPTLSERTLGSVFLAKCLTMAFEVAVVIGILSRSGGWAPLRRWSALHRRPLLILAVMTATAYLVAVRAGLDTAVVLLLVLAGLPTGVGISAGNEYAARRSRGVEDIGMGLYSTVRITGSFLGPLFMNISYPTVLAALGAVALFCTASTRRTTVAELVRGRERWPQ